MSYDIAPSPRPRVSQLPNEPTNEELIAAARKRYGKNAAVNINHRKHTMAVTIHMSAKSHRELLQILEAAT